MKPLGEEAVSDEYPFDGTDNWIPLNDPNSSRFPPFQRYVEAVIRSFESGCSHANLEEWVTIESVYRKLSLDKAECYWEFSVNDPTAFVASIEPALRGYAQRQFISREISFSGAGVGSGCKDQRDINSRCIRVESKVGQFIRVYAKTNRRVRFEVVHKLSGQGRYQQFGAKTADDWDFRDFEQRLKEHSTDALNDLLRWLDQGRPMGVQKTPLELIGAILSGSESHSLGNDVLGLLASNEIVISKGELVQSLRRLKSRGVLVCAGRRYSIAPEYSDALSHIRGNEFQVGRIDDRKS